MKKILRILICLFLVFIGVYNIVIMDDRKEQEMKAQEEAEHDRAVRDYARYAKEKMAAEEVDMTNDSVLLNP